MTVQQNSNDNGKVESYFTAIGAVNGTLTKDDGESHWQLTVGEHQYRATFNRWKNQLGQKIQFDTLQSFRVYPWYDNKTSQFEFQIIGAFQIREQEPILTLQGCWEQNPKQEGMPCLVIHRNEKKNKADKAPSIYLPLVWPNAPEPDGRFWHLKARLQAHQLIIIQVEGPFPKPLTWQQRQELGIPFYYPQSSKKKKKKQNKQNQQPQEKQAEDIPPLSVAQIQRMAMETKIQITCKIAAVPQSRTVDGKVEFFLADGDRILTIRVKPKLFKKLTDHSFDSWVAAISGELGPETETGFEVINPGIQVFEKKSKEKKTEPAPGESQASASSRGRGPQQTETPKQQAQDTVAEPQKPNARKKRLTDGIRFG